jgi:hypothetical protein
MYQQTAVQCQSMYLFLHFQTCVAPFNKKQDFLKTIQHYLMPLTSVYWTNEHPVCSDNVQNYLSVESKGAGR